MPRPIPTKKHKTVVDFGKVDSNELGRIIFQQNEITGSYHNEKKTDPVLVAVGVFVVVCGVIYLLAF